MDESSLQQLPPQRCHWPGHRRVGGQCVHGQVYRGLGNGIGQHQHLGLAARGQRFVAGQLHTLHGHVLRRQPGSHGFDLLGAIVGIELAVERWEGVWKVSQNRTDTDRAGVVQGLMAEGTSAAQDMAALVRVA